MTGLPAEQTRVVLARRPDGVPVPDDFALETAPVPHAGPDETVVRVVDLSLDPYVRSTLTGRNLGHEPIAPGALVPGRSLARVVGSGDWVLAETGWQEYAAVPSAGVRPVTIPDGVPRSAVLSTLGMPGLTAYAAHTRMLRPQPGETVVVSAAVGGVGSVAGQLARLAGARAVAVVSGPEKCRLALERYGYAAAVDRLAPDLPDRLAQACPDRVDAFLHMSGGDVLDAVVRQLAVRGRVVLCGLPDHSNEVGVTVLPTGPLISARAVVHGLIVYDHEDLRPEFEQRVGALVAAGDVVVSEERHDGLASAPAAFSRLAAGRNLGKVVVTVSPD